MRIKSESEVGRRYAIEYPLFSKPAELLANRIPADAITVFGAAAGVVGSCFLANPEETILRIQELTNNSINPTKKQIKLAGIIALSVSYVCDLLDGAVARKSKKGPTHHGTILDGVVNKIVDTTPVVLFLSKTDKSVKRKPWLSLMYTAPLATMIRSRGLAYDVPISKAGLAARAGRVPVLLAGLLFEDKRDATGKILALQTVISAALRYKQISDSGDEEALKAVNRDIVEYTAMFMLGRIMIKKPLPRELLTLGLCLAKLGQVKVAEANRQQPTS